MRTAFGLALARLPLLLLLWKAELSQAKDECQPITWGEADASEDAFFDPLPPMPDQFAKFGPGGPKVGDLECQLYTSTDQEVNYFTCTEIAQYGRISNDEFFLWNPELKPDCSNIKSWSWYCIAGVFEPLRAWDGKCGPLNKNATCSGTDKPCCNAKTWTCGATPDDCKAGNCYEGDCPGHDVFSTDGNLKGVCGDGEDFCGAGKCAYGNCTFPPTAPPGFGTDVIPRMLGNTTDGSCGGPDALMCGVVWGNCCSREGRCGGLPSHCGPGCQPQFGQCDHANPTSTTTPTPQPTIAFQFQPHRRGDCSGDSGIGLVKISSGSDGQCVNLDCNVASLDIHEVGSCPSGEVMISYWQQPNCAGEWYGYGYGSRGACRHLWDSGKNSKSLWVKCAPQSADCVSKGTCTPDPAPKVGICSQPATAFSLKSRHNVDCTGDVHNSVSVQSGSNGMCIDTDCKVGSLDIAGAGDCPDGDVQMSYWEKPGCAGEWYGYGYASRNTCPRLWTDGKKFKSMWLKCAKKGGDCLSAGTCKIDPEPKDSKC